MTYLQPTLTSSFQKNDLGQTIYNKTIDLNPRMILELGVLNGYSTSSLIQALGALQGNRTIVSIDLFEDYPYNSCTQQQYKQNLLEVTKAHPNVTHYVLKQDVLTSLADISNRFPNPNMLFVDISNDGEKLLKIFEYYQCPIMFEGGSSERDVVSWMTTYQKKPIRTLLEYGINYTVIDQRFPSLSISNV